MIRRLTKIFLSRAKAQELIYLNYDLKPVVRQGFYDYQLKEIVDFCIKNNLSYTLSDFKMKLMEKGYANKAMKVPIYDSGMRVIYISKKKRYANLAKRYEEFNDHQKLGFLLGYPRCCVDYFCRVFNHENTNPELHPTNPYTNIKQRKKDNVIISHFPCNSNCTKSIDLSKAYLKVIHEVNPNYARFLFDELSTTLK